MSNSYHEPPAVGAIVLWSLSYELIKKKTNEKKPRTDPIS